ncbi:4ank: A designed ankyrin repeat protein with four identical consensus repeats, partial [Fusarium oxysporum Fo47]|uniref:4ank: A designed ankyrin repeat protein with four identical consensus repeats n=1 Tax=Fusarium oxysporum Fo47 TaxID=660027 RepID=UPI002869D20D
TALQLAVERGNKDIIKALLDKRADVNLSVQLGRTALLLAAENGDNDIVDLLLKNGAEQEKGDKASRTPLFVAVANGDKAMTKTLLGSAKNTLNVTSLHDRNLLDVAVDSGNRDVVWLIAEKASSFRSGRGQKNA